ncbi:mitotubule-associated protein Gb4, partial [Trypanosoma rangeli]
MMHGTDGEAVTPVAADKLVTVSPLSLHVVAPLAHTQVRSSDAQAIPPAVDIGDLIAYEWFDDTTSKWRCELATVLDKPETDKLLVEQLVQKAQKKVSGVVATTEEGWAILEQLSDLQEELSQHVAVADKRSCDFWEKRRAVEREQQELEAALELAREQIGDVRTAVEKIDIHHWCELVSYRSPPEIVVRVMAAVMLVLGERRRTWAEITPILHRPGLVQLLVSFDSTELTRAQREEVLTRYINAPKFTYEEAIKGSSALSELYRWVVAHVLMINASEHKTHMSQLHACRSSELDGMELLMREDSEKIAEVSGKVEALWQQFREVEEFGHSGHSASRSLTNGDSHSASPHRSLTETPTTVCIEETPHAMSLSWHYTSTPQRRIISIYSVLCRLGPAPHRGNIITLQHHQCKELLASVQERHHSSHYVLQPEREACSQSDINNNEAPQTTPPEELSMPSKKLAAAIAKMEHHLQKTTANKAALQRELQQNITKNKKEQTPFNKHDHNHETMKRTPQKPFQKINELQRKLKFHDTPVSHQEPSPQEKRKEKAGLESRLQERDDALAELQRQLEKNAMDKAGLKASCRSATMPSPSCSGSWRRMPWTRRRLKAGCRSAMMPWPSCSSSWRRMPWT